MHLFYGPVEGDAARRTLLGDGGCQWLVGVSRLEPTHVTCLVPSTTFMPLRPGGFCPSLQVGEGHISSSTTTATVHL